VGRPTIPFLYVYFSLLIPDNKHIYLFMLDCNTETLNLKQFLPFKQLDECILAALQSLNLFIMADMMTCHTTRSQNKTNVFKNGSVTTSFLWAITQPAYKKAGRWITIINTNITPLLEHMKCRRITEYSPPEKRNKTKPNRTEQRQISRNISKIYNLSTFDLFFFCVHMG